MPRSLRLLLTLLAAAIGFVAALIGLAGAMGAVAWLFVFGDNEWPAWVEPVIMTLASLGALAFAAMAGTAVWRTLGRAGSAGN